MTDDGTVTYIDAEFIGGYAHGRRMFLPAGTTRWEIPIPADRTVHGFSEASDIPNTPTMLTDTYEIGSPPIVVTVRKDWYLSDWYIKYVRSNEDHVTRYYSPNPPRRKEFLINHQMIREARNMAAKMDAFYAQLDTDD